MDDQRNGQALVGQDSGSNGTTIRLQVPNTLIGSIIGKQGETIKAIREQSQAKVNIADSQPGEDRDLTLKGSLQSLEQAINLIITNLSQNRNQPYPSDQPLDDSLSVKVLVANDQAGAIIGKGGEVIKQLREESGARISIGKKVDFVRVITVMGSSAALRAALSVLARLIHDHPSSARNPFLHGFRAQPASRLSPASAYQPNAYNFQTAAVSTLLEAPGFANETFSQTQTMTVPNRSVGAIIGKGGQTINDIRMISGCRIEVGSQTEGSQVRTITFTGTNHSIEVARLLILQKQTSRPPYE
jgi:predicted RNA-binding protein YlqC (UPF0109 family)